MLRWFIAMLVLAGSLAAQGGGRVPVVLLNGWQLNCPTSPSQLADSAETFGTMEAQLRAEGYQVFYFNNCTEGRIPIEDLGAKFGEFLTRNNLGVVDVVAHSMGGLIIRAYLSGKTKDPADAQGNPTQFFNPPRATPPVQPRVRKAIFLGTPHYGAGFGGFVTDLQALQMQPSSQFLFDLATWNQGTDD
nr:hypothetical protein [Bryobacter sp.]